MEFLKSALFIEYLVDWPTGTLLALVVYVSILSSIAFLAYLLYTKINEHNCPAIRGPATIVGKCFVAAHTRLEPGENPIDGTLQMVRIDVPNQWFITIMIEGTIPLKGTLSVVQPLFEMVNEGDTVNALYYVTRLSRELKPQELYQDVA